MATLTAFRFDTAGGADNALPVVSILQAQQLVTVLDAALVSWPKGKNRPITRQVLLSVGKPLLDGTFWGMLFGLIFFLPVLDVGAGPWSDQLASSFADVGIDESFIYQVRSNVTEVSSALFVLSEDVSADIITEASEGRKPHSFATSLASNKEIKLRHLFGPAGNWRTERRQ
jgi:uncharacterized membrane protein